jgi:hypothetical protein
LVLSDADDATAGQKALTGVAAVRVWTTLLKAVVDSAGSSAYVVFVLLAELFLLAGGHVNWAEDYAPSLMLGIFAWLAKREWI